MTKIVDIEDIRKKREKKEIGIPIENINKKELKRRGHEIGDILGCDEKGEEICVRKGKGNLYVDGDMEKEQLFDFMRSQIYQNIQRGDSMVIVDLGIRIYKRELWIYLTIHGYRVDSYNMDCMTESDCFNCLDGLGAENEEQIVMIANDIIDDQKYKFMTYPVETACKALLSAVLLASLTEMEESDRNMLEIATIFRLGVSGTMLDKILHVMFEELDETSSAKQLFAMYSEAEEGIRMEAIQKIGNALAVYEKRANGSLCDNFRTNRYDMEMPVKEKSDWHEWETVIKYCDQQMHLQGKPIDLEQLKSDTVIAHQMFEKIVQDYLNHGDSVISNKLNNEHRPENQRPQQKTKWQSPETKIIHPAEPSMQERFNRAWKKVNDEEAAAGETDEGALEGAVKCMMEK